MKNNFLISSQTAMKTVVIVFVCFLNVVECRQIFLQTKLERSINELLIKRNFKADECLNQLVLLNDNLKQKQSSWAKKSKL
jgi:hypothetical protein